MAYVSKEVWKAAAPIYRQIINAVKGEPCVFEDDQLTLKVYRDSLITIYNGAGDQVFSASGFVKLRQDGSFAGAELHEVHHFSGGDWETHLLKNIIPKLSAA